MDDKWKSRFDELWNTDYIANGDPEKLRPFLDTVARSVSKWIKEDTDISSEENKKQWMILFFRQAETYLNKDMSMLIKAIETKTDPIAVDVETLLKSFDDANVNWVGVGKLLNAPSGPLIFSAILNKAVSR